MPTAVRARWTLLTLLLLVAVAGGSRSVHGQGPRGAGPDARTPAAGQLRMGFVASWTRQRESYVDGALRGLGEWFTLDSLGPGVLRFLATADAATQVASGMPGFRATAGSLATHVRGTVESTPLLLEAGLSSKLAIGVTVPFVTSIVRVGTVINRAGTEANMGLNPAIAAPALATANGTLVSQIEGAASFLNARLASCAANPGAPGCAAVNVNSGSARALVDDATAFANALATLYGGRNGSVGTLFVPLANSVAHAAVAARLSGFKSQFVAFGATAISAAAPVGAPAPLTTSGFQSVLTDSAFGISAHPLESVVRRGVGDVDVSATYTWHDSYARSRRVGRWRERLWWRGAVVGSYRLATGAEADAADLVPVRLGDHQPDIEGRLITDVGVGERWSVTAVTRYTVQGSALLDLRVPAAPMEPFPEVFRTLTATRDPGDELGVEVFPRWTPTEAVSVAAYYGYRSRGSDTYTGTAATADPAGTPVTLDAASLGAGTAHQEHRLGGVVAYSTVGAWTRGRARWPIELAISHFQTTRGSGGAVPKLAHDAVTVRWYWQPFGRRAVEEP